MNQRTKEKMAIFLNAFAQLEDKRKNLQEIEKKALEDLSECKKRIQEVRSNKKKVPLFSTRLESLTGDTLEESKENRKGRRRKAAEKANAKNAASSRVTLKTKLRKRTCDEDLVEEQPLPKIRKDVTVVKVVQEDTSIKSSNENKTFAQKRSMLDPLTPPSPKKSLFEITNTIITENTGISELNKVNATLKNNSPLSSEEECKDEENLEPINNAQQKGSSMKEITTDVGIAGPSIPSIITTNATTLLCDEGSPIIFATHNKTRCTRSKLPKDKEIVSSTSSEPSSNEESPVKPRFTRSKMTKTNENKSTLPLTANTSPLEEQKVLSVPVPELRMTRSKMAKSKKGQVDSSSRSGEESDTRSEHNFCSDGETGKKKVKDLIKMINDRQAKVILSPVKLTKEQEKENLNSGGILRILEKKERRTPSRDRRGIITKTTPLQVRNGYITPNKKPLMVTSSTTRNKSAMDDAEQRKKEEEVKRKRLKEEEVLRKKQEMIKIKQEEMKKKHEEKMLKAAAMREAAEREKNEFILKQEKEREERERMAKEELERKKIEEAMKKKLANQLKTAEVETRRLKEEAARQARLKELEEEQRYQEELRQKQQEENEKNLKMRQEELRAKDAIKHKVLHQKELIKKQKANVLPLKDKDNYSISQDLAADDDDDELYEDSSDKEYPAWAKREEVLHQRKIHAFCPMALVKRFFCCPSSSPDLTDIFGKMTMKRIRSSSAVWNDTLPISSFI